MHQNGPNPLLPKKDPPGLFHYCGSLEQSNYLATFQLILENGFQNKQSVTKRHPTNRNRAPLISNRWKGSCSPEQALVSVCYRTLLSSSVHNSHASECLAAAFTQPCCQVSLSNPEAIAPLSRHLRTSRPTSMDPATCQRVNSATKYGNIW